MLTIRAANERGHANYGWLDAYHTFSFADYFDSAHMGFGPLRVINEDWVAPGKGFAMHGHRDMEVVTYIIEGSVEHKDNTGQATVIGPETVQRMSAGTGIRHSEYNPSTEQTLHLLQIWIEPAQEGLTPNYEYQQFSTPDRQSKLQIIASPDGVFNSLTIHQDVVIMAAKLAQGEQISHVLQGGRKAWLQMVQGSVVVNGLTVHVGDGVAISDEEKVEIAAQEEAEFLLFDLA